MVSYPTTSPRFVAARPIRVASRASIFPYDKLMRMMTKGRTRKVRLARRPFIRSKSNVTGKAEYPDYIISVLADVADIR
jgi:hypothetical protein